MPSAASELELDPNNGIVAITEFAGRGYQSTANGVGTNAGFNHPYGVNIFGDGQYALIADANSNRLCRAVISTQTITTIAGGAFAGGTDGVGSNALFSYPTGISISPDETFALVTDFSNSCIRRLEMSSGSVSTVAGVCSGATNKTDGFGTNVGFANPYDISVSPDGTYALITDTYNSIIRRMDIATGEVTTVFGVPAIPGTSNGVGTNARLQGPYGLDISSDGTFALVADSLNHIIRHIDLATSTMTTIAGGGPTGNGVGTNARFFNPRSIKISPGGTAALITEVDSHLIRHLDISTGSVTTFAGSTTGSANGFGTNAQFISPGGISIYRPPNVNVSLFLVGDTYNHLVRRGQYFPDGVPLPSPTESPTAAPTTAPSAAPTTAPSAAPTEFIPYCAQLLSFDDAHGSYSTWMTSFLKYDGYFSGGDDDDDYGFKTGYIPFMSALQISGVYGVKPTVMLGLRDANVATFSVVPGKLDASGDLMPCEIESTASGPCFNSRSWEVGLSAKSFFNSVYSTETDAWIAPFGSSMTNECFQESEWGGFFETRLRPVSFTGEGRSDNNVPPPSFHVPPPLPHHSVEVSLTLKDEGGFGWWNTIKYHSNQYVLDDGEKILHRGTLVGKSQVTEKFRLLDGTYSLRMLGNLDTDAGDDTWSLMLQDREISSGGRYDRVSFTISKGELSSVVPENVIDLGGVHSASPLHLANFPGLVTAERLQAMTNDPALVEAETAFLQHMLGDQISLGAGDSPTTATVSTFGGSLVSHPLESIGLFVGSAMIGMVSVLGVLRLLSPSSKNSYSKVMDDSNQLARGVPAAIELEKPLKLSSPDLLL